MTNPYYNPDYNPYNQSMLIGTGVFFIILPIFTIVLRFYSRLSGNVALGIDDWIAVPAGILCVALAIVQIIAVTGSGLGGHLQLDAEGKAGHTPKLYIYEKTRFAYDIIGTACLCLTKLSVLFFFRRIFRVRSFIVTNNILIGLVAAWGIAYNLGLLLQCVPISLLWEKLESEYAEVNCVNSLPFYISFAYTNLILDVIIYLLPVPHLWSLMMPARQKLAIGLIFLLGSIVVAISISRTIIYTWVVDFASHEPLLWWGDLTWYSSGVLFWHLAENAIGLLGASMPSYASLVKNKLHGRNSSNRPNKSSTRGSGIAPGSPFQDQNVLARAFHGNRSHRGFEEITLDPITQPKTALDASKRSNLKDSDQDIV
ncbi:hypothetical protein F4860DRAFT_508980 [Xylaria cubensis]|nr:hypothetical protein F4860DRAFT_508980 [Xylaria cubensis]